MKKLRNTNQNVEGEEKGNKTNCDRKNASNIEKKTTKAKKERINGENGVIMNNVRQAVLWLLIQILHKVETTM